MPVPLSGLKAHPVAYLGPQVARLFVEAIETGILLQQSFAFWGRGEHDALSFQTSLSFYTIWQIFVLNFGDWMASVNFTWCARSQSLLTMCMAAPVQAFLIWRCWTLLNRGWPILTLLSLLLLASVISSIIVTVETFQIQFTVLPTTSPMPELPSQREFRTVILSLTSSAVLDVAVTSILLTYLAQSKPSVISSRFRRIMKRLTILVWEAAVPPCVCAIITAVTYCTSVNHNYWDLAFQSMLGKLYVISLFVTLNGRAELRNVPAVPAGTTSHLISMLLTPSALIRLDISRDPEAAHPRSLSPTERNSDLANSPGPMEPCKSG
ncbi:hypothetical protein B0H21DRAFT_756903 [Amylocystis lapponica]|nr:hypothetical protein B0H21DRAFT_756903 [Amylocystis lapponica]